jgi:hypothetical protein
MERPLEVVRFLEVSAWAFVLPGDSKETPAVAGRA